MLTWEEALRTYFPWAVEDEETPEESGKRLADETLASIRKELEEKGEKVMQHILFADEFEQMIRDGRKTQTTRAGARVYRVGEDTELVFNNGHRLDAEIVEVRWTTLDRLTQADAEADGFESVEALIQKMGRFYPSLIDNTLRPNSVITVVKFRLKETP